MKETDYLNSVKGIREEYVEEAMTWDGNEKRRKRDIRRMSLGIGAIAASIAVVAGCMVYSVKNKPPRAKSAPALSADEVNFLGGHGEITPYRGTNDAAILRDADYFYSMPQYGDGVHFSCRWNPSGNENETKLEVMDTNYCILTDGERMYQPQGLQLSVIDSSGSRTEFFRLTTDCPGFELVAGEDLDYYGIRHLSGDYYAIQYDVPAMNRYTVIYNAKEKQIVTYENPYLMPICAAADGSGFYALDGTEGYLCRHSFSEPTQVEKLMQIPDGTIDMTGSGDMIYYTVEDEGGWYYSYNAKTGETKDLNYSTSGHYYLDDYVYQVFSDNDNYHVYRSNLDMTDKREIFCESLDSLFGDVSETAAFSVVNETKAEYNAGAEAFTAYSELTGTAEKHDVLLENIPYAGAEMLSEYAEMMNFAEAGDYVIFNFEEPTKKNIAFVQANLSTDPVSVILVTQGEEIMGDHSYGYVTDDDTFPFAHFYIPQEHTAERTDEIECYRMLPFRNAWESALDPSVFLGYNENRGDAPRLTKERAKEICDTNDDYGKAMTQLMEEGGWDVEWTSGVTCEEIWLDDRGKELILVHDFSGITYFRYDEEQRQYYFERWKAAAFASNPDSGTVTNLPKEYEFKAHYIRTDSTNAGTEYPQYSIIRSRGELDDYIAKYKEWYDLGSADSTDANFMTVTGQYTDEWFETHQLILVLLEESSGSVTHQVTELTESDVTIQRIVPEVGTADMAEWHIVIEADKDCVFMDPDFDVFIEDEDDQDTDDEMIDDFEAHIVRTDGYHEGTKYPQVSFIRSRAELEDYITRNKEQYNFGSADGTAPSFMTVTGQYTDEWFKTHQLILVLLEEGSGSIRHEVTELTESDVTIQRIVPEGGTEDMAEWHILIEAGKDCKFAEPDAFGVFIEDETDKPVGYQESGESIKMGK